MYRKRAIISRSWILTSHKVRILRKKASLAFKNGLKSIQTAGYNGARMVIPLNFDDFSHIFFRALWKWHRSSKNQVVTLRYDGKATIFTSKSGIRRCENHRKNVVGCWECNKIEWWKNVSKELIAMRAF